MKSQPESSFVEANGIYLHYLAWEPARQTVAAETGEQPVEGDEVPLVLLHGLAASADAWRLLAPLLAQQRTVYAFDLRGHGESEQAPNGYDLTTMMEDIVAGMAALGLGQVALVGHATGARLALLLAARHPALVSQLVLVDGAYDEPRFWPGMTRERYVRREIIAPVYSSCETFVETMCREMAAYWSPEVEEIVLSYVRERSDGCVEPRLLPENQRKIREALWDESLVPFYGRVTCPVLLIPAASEPRPGESPPERLEEAPDFAAARGLMALRFARALPHCAIYWMPETAMDLQLHRPQRLANGIARFLKG